MRDLSSFITQGRKGGEGEEGGISRPKNTKIMIVLTISFTPFTPAKHVLLNWFSLNENYKQRTEKLDFPLDSSTC